MKAVEELINHALSLIEQGRSKTEIHEFLCRSVGARTDNDAPSREFANRLTALVNQSPAGEKSAVIDWIVVAYQNTGRADKGFVQPCPAHLALKTAKGLLSSS